MSEKDKQLDYSTENLAFPEVHVKKKSPDKEQTDEDEGDILFDTVAVPEIKLHHKKK